jgi:protein OS-9
MRQTIAALLATAPVFASQNVFSVHDDILAFPQVSSSMCNCLRQCSQLQYEVIFSDALISDIEASLIVEQASSSSASSSSPPQSSNSKNLESHNHDRLRPTSATPYTFDPSHETYELMYLNGEKHLCIVPIVDTPPRNETAEAEARAAEQKELARATDRGWELLQDLEGNCLYFVSGWWSYSFCYNAEITQFHQLPPQPGKVPQRDPKTTQYVLGRARGKPSRHDEWGNEVEVHKAKKIEPPKTELQVKGDTRYLVQKMEGGTTCDLTGKPRRVEVQYHCNPHLADRIGYIKEVTTCSYLMVVYTPRLCNDVAFMPPKENKANSIVCRVIVPEDDLDYRYELRTLESELQDAEPKDTRPRIGGLIVGAGKWMNKDGARMPIPTNFGKETKGRTSNVIVKAKAKTEGGQVESVSDADLLKLDLDPKVVEQLKEDVRKVAKDKGWRIEVIEEPGEVMSVLGIVDEDEQDDQGDDGEEGSEEIYKDEL